MKVVLDTNTLFSALISDRGYPSLIYGAWLDAAFELFTCEQQIRELRVAGRAPKFVGRLEPHRVGFTVNRLRRSTVCVEIPRRYDAVNPTDSYLLDLAAFAEADYLVTGDKRSGLLQLGHVKRTRIVSPAQFATETMLRGYAP